MFIFGGVDKRQARFQDFHEFNFEQRTWSATAFLRSSILQAKIFKYEIIGKGLFCGLNIIQEYLS